MDNEAFVTETGASLVSVTSSRPSHVSVIQIGEGGNVLSINDAHAQGHQQMGAADNRLPSTPPPYEESVRPGETPGSIVEPKPYIADTNIDRSPPANGKKMGVEGINGTAHLPNVAVVGEMEQEMKEYEKLQQERRDREPLLFCKLITEHPKKAFAMALAGQMFFLFLTAVLQATGYDIIPLVFERLPLELKDDVDYLRGLAWDYRTKDHVFIQQGVESSGEQSVGSELMNTVQFLYNHPDDENIFTTSYLQAIKDVEDSWYNSTDYNNTYCYRPAGTCAEFTSILRYFDGSMAYISPTFNDPTFSNIVDVVNEAYNNSLTRTQFVFFLGADFIINDTYVYSAATRSIMRFGWPLPGYTNTTDRPTEQEAEYELYIEETLLPLALELYEDRIDGMEYLFSNEIIFSLLIIQQVMSDFILVALAFLFIMVFVMIQTGSFWVAGFAVLSIVTGFCCANAVYRIVFDFRYFGIFNILALFIILGIGADDVFVFFDTWKQTAQHKYKSLAHRMSDCYRKASVAMLFTSMTTGAAFFVSAASPFLAVYSFGAFAGLLVVVNYISVIVFFPCVVTTYHLYWEKYKCCCCCPTSQVMQDGSPAEEPKKLKKNFVVAFFSGPYYRLVTHKVIRWVLLVFYVVVFAVMAFLSSKLQVEEEQIEFLRESTPLGRFLAVAGQEYYSLSSEAETYIYLAWGLDNQDVSACHHTDSVCFGYTVWDTTFDPNLAQAQEDLASVCENIRGLSAAEADELRISRDFFTGIPEVECFITDMKDLYQSLPYGFPLTATEVANLMTSESSVYTSALPNATLQSNYFEVGMSYWLVSNSSSFTTYSNLLGEVATGDLVTSSINGMTYYYGTDLRYAGIRVRTTIQANSLGYPAGLPIRDKWEEYTSNMMANLSSGVGNGFQCTPEESLGFNLWHWLKVQEKLVYSAVQGIIIGILIAIPILIIATNNIIIGLMSSGIITAITVCVVGVIPAAGWKLGLLESLNLVLVVGLSVDYIVHLAEGYARSIHRDRLARTHDMLTEVGISVVSGAVTTIGASIFMLPSQIIIFTKFGLFMFSTIGFSLLFALGFFPVVVALIGPQNRTGSLTDCCGKIFPCFKKS